MWPTEVNGNVPPSFIDAVFNSNHPGILNFLFADGSVHGLSAQLDPVVRGEMKVRNDGLPVGNEWGELKGIEST